MARKYGQPVGLVVLGAMVLCAVWLFSIVPIKATYDTDPAVVRHINHWVVANDPAVNTAATATRAASSTGGVHVADCMTATLIANTTAPAAAAVTVVLRDGLTGAGTVLWSADLALVATAGDHPAPIQLCGFAIPGTANTAMTIEFTAAGGANTFEAVGLTGYDRAP